MAATAGSLSPAIFSLSSFTATTTTTNVEPPPPILSLTYPNFFTTNAASRKNPIFRLSRLRISHKKAVVAPKFSFRVLAVSDLVDDNSEVCPELGPSSVSSSPHMNSVYNDSHMEATTIDIKLPRRSLMVQFTCDLCGERTQRLVNRLAYERGTVFVQCAGCLQHHKLVDNLGLVVEYDLREDISVDPDANQV